MTHPIANQTLPELSLEDILAFASQEKFDCVEIMCWPAGGGGKRRYAGVTHIDVSELGVKEIQRIKDMQKHYKVTISGLGYYPNPLTPDKVEADIYVKHIKKVITASAKLGIGVMNTFIGRDPAKSIEDNWKPFEKTWKPIIKYAEAQKVKIGIENCPMLFSLDEWPGGKNLAISPEIWRKMFASIPSKNFGLNHDLSHLLWLGIDHIRAIHEFGDEFVHVHIKDTRINPEKVYERGIMTLKWHDPKIPGLGDIDWVEFCKTLRMSSIKVAYALRLKHRAFEENLESRKEAVRQSKRHIDLATTKA
ncbi:MAG: sugar phosphate isomerase/epimerase family protein [Trueperaceae bacterium]